jgi:hypothetical protein
LGVFHARQNIEAWGGTLDFSSVPGKGTLATIRLPRAEAPTWYARSLPVPPGGNVVLVDDESATVALWRQRLGELAPLTHLSSVEAWREWWRGRSASAHSVFLFDLDLKDDSFNGLDLIEELADRKPAFVVTSRFEEGWVQKRCTELGVRLMFLPQRTL